MEKAEQLGEEAMVEGKRREPGDVQSLESAPETQPSVPAPDLQMELDEVRRRWLESHRRALLAENAGRVVPELVVGCTVEELDRSVEAARSALEAAKAAAQAEAAAIAVPVGNPVRQEPSVESMSPLQKIAYGLKRE